MPHVSRGLIALLCATVVFFALWMVALKPGGSGGSSGSTSQGLGQYQSAINAAHGAVQTASADNARAGADPAPAATSTAPAAKPAPVARVTSTPHATTRSKPPIHPRAVPKPVRHPVTAGGRLAAVQRALRSHKVVALLFYNPAAPDDRAVDQELQGVPTRGRKVFKLAIPLGEIGNYMAIVNEVPVNISPTLVLVAPDHQVDEIVGYADPFEISQRVDQALALR